MKGEKLGKVVNQIQGYRVRIVVEDEKGGKKKYSYGIYAGKKLIKGGFKNVDEANQVIMELLK